MDTEIIIAFSLLLHIAISCLVGYLGSKRTLGFGWAFAASFFLTPVLGLLIVLCHPFATQAAPSSAVQKAEGTPAYGTRTKDEVDPSKMLSTILFVLLGTGLLCFIIIYVSENS